MGSGYQWNQLTPSPKITGLVPQFETNIMIQKTKRETEEKNVLERKIPKMRQVDNMEVKKKEQHKE